MNEAVIVAGARSAIGRSGRGSLRHTRPDEFGSAVLKEMLSRVAFDPAEIEDIILGCATPEAEQGMNMARIVGLRAGLPTNVAGMTINRFCSSGLQSIALAAQGILAGTYDAVVAGGVESMSRLPMGGYNLSPNPYLAENFPDAYISMGHTAEEVARRFGVSREDQDAFALRSHRLAAAANDEGKLDAQIVPLQVSVQETDEDGRTATRSFTFSRDEGIRRETTLDALAKLKPAFSLNGSVTAGNSSQTSDGAAAVLMMSAKRAAREGLNPIGVFRSFAVAGVDPDIMGVGPVAAVPKALEKAGLSLAEIDLIELNEAFAAQAVQVIRALGMNEEIVNVNGGAIAIGHPLGCTGTRQTVDLLEELKRQKKRYGLVTMCIGGGMGAAGVIERV
ncbi:acetyl-CoA C-acyltransferase [Ferroacidibacillus organovorans]|uniref:acetyl-CoA C-acyltransferase n=1 Tax=Ferroacidibacillus organovorans TaxID=1765683 RepID=A0A853KE45_9BACL|nr:acetyl-CoA C-acyltransferase [Ferroacidibacillus organovorans]KYP80870.1 acetyl-CoA acetyltransferase [Ferroacidibacillus organovorans]OAG95415.1 acetyl-CoA acetyltransferase [Ferroacidibacillus organovorans]